MATVRPFEIPGLKLWFWSFDHEPPHFHVKRKGEWEIKVHFMRAPGEMIEVIGTGRGPGRNMRRQITRLAETHRVELLEQWEEIHGD